MRTFPVAVVVLAAVAAHAQYKEADVANGGTISGKITYDSPPPKPQKLVIKDPNICGATHDDDRE
jgi:hypothetical protein